MKIAYVGNFSQLHCTESHIAKTLENMGHQVTRIQEDMHERTTLVNKVRNHDLFLFTRTWSTLVTLEHLALFKQMGIPTASFHLDLYVGLQRDGGLGKDPFWKTDYVFSPDGSEQAAKVFRDNGINHFYSKPGVFKDECIKLEPNNDPELGGDVVFVGGGVEYGHPEWPYRKQLVEWLENNYGSRYKKYGHPQKTVRNTELNQLYANAKIVVGDSVCLNFNHPYYWSDRVYETIGRGGFIIHPYIPGMEEEFTDGENIVFYEYNSWDQLKSKIDFYLANPEERERVRLNGFNFVKEHATYNNRMEKMLDTIFPKETKQEGVAMPKQEAIRNMKCELHEGHGYLTKSVDYLGYRFKLRIYDYAPYMYTKQGRWCPADDIISEQIDQKGNWEQYETALIVDILKQEREHGTVVDFGSQVGWYSMLALLSGYRVTSYEIDQESAQLLKESAELNGFSVGPEGVIQVNNVGVDETTEAVPPQDIDFMKCDIEGYEEHAYRMYKSSFEQKRVKYAVFEISPVFNDSYPKLVQDIVDNGYSAYIIPSGSSPNARAFLENPLTEIKKQPKVNVADIPNWHQYNVLFVRDA